MSFLTLICVSTCFLIVDGQIRPKVNVKLDDRLQLVKSENGQLKVVLKAHPTVPLSSIPLSELQALTQTEPFEVLKKAEPLEISERPKIVELPKRPDPFDILTQEDPFSALDDPFEALTKVEPVIETKHHTQHLPISTTSYDSETLTNVKVASQNDILSSTVVEVAKTKIDDGPVLEINPMAITASAVNPHLPSIFQMIRNMLKVVCGGFSSAHKLKIIPKPGIHKYCNEHEWTDSRISSQINHHLQLFQNHIPRIGLAI